MLNGSSAGEKILSPEKTTERERRGVETTIILERVLDIKKEGGVYRVTRPMGASFGDEEPTREEVETDINKISGPGAFRHERIKVVERDKEWEGALALLPQLHTKAFEDGRAYVEIDQWAEPLTISVEGLRWIREFEQLINFIETKREEELRFSEKSTEEQKEYRTRRKAERSKDIIDVTESISRILGGLKNEEPRLLVNFYLRLSDFLLTISNRYERWTTGGPPV